MMKIDFSKFGTPEHPIRASSLPYLILCPRRAAIMFAQLFADEAGIAADTGTAVHAAIHAMHESIGKSEQDYIDIAKAKANAPKADWNEVRLHFRGYYSDPRNQGVTIIEAEKSFNTTIKEESTGTEITIQGTFDQIRLDFGSRVLYDIKTSSRYNAGELLDQHTMQLAAYWLLAHAAGIEVDAVGIISTYGYRRRAAELPSPTGVFIRSTLRYSQAQELMKAVFDTVRLVRKGEVFAKPGLYCNNVCPARNVATCLAVLN